MLAEWAASRVQASGAASGDRRSGSLPAARLPPNPTFATGARSAEHSHPRPLLDLACGAEPHPTRPARGGPAQRPAGPRLPAPRWQSCCARHLPRAPASRLRPFGCDSPFPAGDFSPGAGRQGGRGHAEGAINPGQTGPAPPPSAAQFMLSQRRLPAGYPGEGRRGEGRARGEGARSQPTREAPPGPRAEDPH